MVSLVGTQGHTDARARATYTHDNELLVLEIQEHLQCIVAHDAAALSVSNGLSHNIVNVLRCPELFDHRWGGKPRQKNGRRRGTRVERVIEFLQTGNTRGVVCNFRT